MAGESEAFAVEAIDGQDAGTGTTDTVAANQDQTKDTPAGDAGGEAFSADATANGATDGGAGDGTDKASDKDGGQEDGEDKEKSKTEGAPEQYEDFTLPEGATVDETSMTTFVEECRADGLDQAGAQKRLDFLLGWKQKAEAQAANFWAEQQKTWSEAAKEEGLLKPEHLQSASRGLKAADKTGKLGKVLHHLGLDRHPAIIRAFNSHDELTREDTVALSGSGQNTGGVGLADKLYDKTS